MEMAELGKKEKNKGKKLPKKAINRVDKVVETVEIIKPKITEQELALLLGDNYLTIDKSS